MKPKQFKTSSTGIETFIACPRKFVFSKVMRLPQPENAAFAFGNVLHHVIETYMKADDLGRDGNGNAVHLFLPNWDRVPDRFKKGKFSDPLPENQKRVIQTLINTAIEEGMMERIQGRQVELEFNEPIGDAVLNGYIDIRHPRGIIDHKTTKSIKWAKSARET